MLFKALVNREATGVFKLVADAKTLKVLGAHGGRKLGDMAMQQH